MIQIIPYFSPYREVWDAYLSGGYFLCVSNEILNEYQEIIERLSDSEYAQYILETIIHSPFTIYKESSFKFHLITSDPDDNKFVDCAIASNAEYIVSEDKHFNVLSQLQFPVVTVIGLEQFRDSLPFLGKSEENH